MSNARVAPPSSQSSLARKMMDVTVAVCAVNLSASDSRERGVGYHRHIQRPPEKLYKQTHEFVYLGRTVNHDANMSIEVH